MKAYEKIKEHEKRRYEYAVGACQQRLNKDKANNASENILKISEYHIKRDLDNLESLDDATINFIAIDCKTIIKSMQRIYDQYTAEYYSRFDDLINFHFGNTDTDNNYGKNLLKGSTIKSRLGLGSIADLDDLRNCFSGKNPYDENVIEGWINYVNACYTTNFISDAQFNSIQEEYNKNNTDDKMYVKYSEARRDAGKMNLGDLLIHDERYAQYVEAKDKASNFNL